MAALTDRSGESPAAGIPSPAASASLFLVLLLVGDLVYIAIHLVATETTLIHSPLAALDVDRGYAEFFQYMKLLWAGLLLTCLAMRTRQWGYFAWVLSVAYLLADDSLSVHENLGEMLANGLALHQAVGLRAVDFGELLVSATAGAVLGAGIGWAYLRGGDAFRRSSRHLLVLVLALVFFGVGVDMMHSALHPVGIVDKALVILEDGGELVSISFIAWYAFLLVVAGERSRGASLPGLIGAVAAHGVSAFRSRRQAGD